MSLQIWAVNGWLRAHRSSRQEIGELFKIVERDLQDAGNNGLSEDWRFGIAYNAALKLCTILLYAEGFRAEKTLQHYRTIQALPLILGPNRRGDADYLDTCRSKRKSSNMTGPVLLAPGRRKSCWLSLLNCGMVCGGGSKSGMRSW